MMGGGDERVKPLIEALSEMNVKALDTIDKSVREAVAVKIGKSERTVRELLNLLEQRGFLSSDNKRPKTYTLLYPLEDVMEKTIGVSAKLKTADDLHVKMEEEARKWLETILENTPSAVNTYSSKEEETDALERDMPAGSQQSKLENNISTAGAAASNGERGFSKAYPDEISLEDRRNGEPPIPRSDPEGIRLSTPSS